MKVLYRIFNISAFSLILLFSLSLFSCASTGVSVSEELEELEEEETAPLPAEAQEPAESDTITLLFAGDIMAHSVAGC